MSGYLRNCYIVRRDGGPEPFRGTVPYLNGYAMIPTEQWLDRENEFPDRAKLKDQLGHPEPFNPDGYAVYCFFSARKGSEPMMLGDHFGLEDYTIVPLEKFIEGVPL